ncbi:MAG: L,D-transpeptidase [Microgenomates group bacterium]
MFKTWIICITIISVSLFLGINLYPRNRFQPQEDFDPQETTAVFLNSPLLIPKELAQIPLSQKVLGDSNVDKKIYVDLTNQTLYAYEGENLIYSFLVSTGKWGKTPTGVFNIWGKFRYTKMSGGSTALRTYYYLPNVPYVMFYSNDQVAASRGFSLHGTYWHDNFGHPMSHGCVNMKTSEAALIYEWSDPQIPQGSKSTRSTSDNPGTQIIVYGKAPPS